MMFYMYYIIVLYSVLIYFAVEKKKNNKKKKEKKRKTLNEWSLKCRLPSFCFYVDWNDHWNVLYQVSVFMPIGNPRWPPPQDIDKQIPVFPVFDRPYFLAPTLIIFQQIKKKVNFAHGKMDFQIFIISRNHG